MAPENLAEIREILNQKYDDSQLDALCLDYFSDLYDKFARGMRKDEKITLLLDYCRRLPIRWDNLLRLIGKLPEEETEQTFHLPFANREMEKDTIRRWLEADFHVQTHAAGGLGKTYMLREMQREVESSGGQTVWIDFASELHAECRADLYRFLQEFCQQLLGEAASSINTHDEKYALRQIGSGVVKWDNLQALVIFCTGGWLKVAGRKSHPSTELQVAGRRSQMARRWLPAAIYARTQTGRYAWTGK